MNIRRPASPRALPGLLCLLAAFGAGVAARAAGEPPPDLESHDVVTGGLQRHYWIRRPERPRAGAGLVLVLLPCVALYFGLPRINALPLAGLPVLAVFGIMVLFGATLWLHFKIGGPWMHVKLSLVALLLFYYIATGRYLKRAAAGGKLPSSVFFRWYNEIPLLLAIPAIYLAVAKTF